MKSFELTVAPINSALKKDRRLLPVAINFITFAASADRKPMIKLSFPAIKFRHLHSIHGRILALMAAMACLAPLTRLLAAPELEALTQQVDALPSGTNAEKAKKAVLLVALERVQASKNAHMDGEATALLGDVQNALSAPADAMAKPAVNAPHISLFARVPVTVKNPYLDALVKSANAQLSKPEAPLERATLDKPVIVGLTAGRAMGDSMRDYLWLYANPASPMNGNQELLVRILRRGHAFIDAFALESDPRCTAKSGISDQFATELGTAGVVEFATAYPNLLLPSQRKQWDAGINSWAAQLGKSVNGFKNWNLNIETARVVAALNLGYYTKNQELVKRALKHVDGTLAKMRPDGGLPYNGSSNPSANYHNEIFGSLGRIYDISGYAPIAAAMKAAQWKGPVMGQTDEMWTSPFHKTARWNILRGVEAGNEMVVALSGNPYARYLMSRFPAGAVRDNICWYRSDIPAKPLPDNYTIVDRNVEGPRAWYGRFTYSGTLHSVPTREAGHETLFGAMTVDAADGRLNSVLTDVTPRVRVSREDGKNAKGLKISAVAKLTSDLKGAFLTGKHYSASSAVHGIATVLNFAYPAAFTDWEGRQIWLGLPDRLIGLVSTVPKKDGAEAFAIEGVLRFVSGGTAGAAVPKELKKISDRQYQYGELDIIIHATSYPELTAETIPYRVPKYPAYELTFRSAAGGIPATPQKFKADANYSFVVEIRPNWTTSPAVVKADFTGPVLGLQASANGKNWQVFFNPSSSPKSCPPFIKPSVAGTTSLRLTGVNNGLPTRNIPSGLSLNSGQEAVFVTSNDPKDHETGWDSFEQMVGASPAAKGAVR